MKLVGVVRVSTDQQEGIGGEGLERQRHEIRKIAQREGVSDVLWVEIVGVSGSAVAQTREWLQEVLPAIRDPDTHIAVDSIDRLIRASNLDLGVLSSCQATATKIYTPQGVRDLSKADDALVSGILALLAGKEKVEITRRAQAGKEQRRKAGHWVSGIAPRGTQYDRKNGWTYTGEAQAIADAYDRFLAGESSESIASDLGYTRNSIKNVLTNTIYKGIVTFDQRRGEAYPTVAGRQPERKKIARKDEDVIRVRIFGGEGQLPQLVSDETWAKAQAKLVDRVARISVSMRETSKDAYLSGFVRAHDAPDTHGAVINGFFDLTGEQTGHVAYGHNTGKTHNNQVRYVCACKSTRTKGIGKCQFGEPPVARINIAVDRYLVSLTRDKDVVSGAREAAKKTPDTTSERKRLEKLLDGFAAKEARLADLYVDGRIDRAKHDQQQDGIRKDRRDAEAKLAGVVAGPVQPTAIELDATFAPDAWVFDSSWSNEQKRAWCKKYVSAIFVSQIGIESISLRLPTADGGVLYPHSDLATWADLLGGDKKTAMLIPSSNGLLLSQVAERLGTTAATLKRLYRFGKLPEPATRVRSGMRMWSEAELAATKAAFEALATR